MDVVATIRSRPWSENSVSPSASSQRPPGRGRRPSVITSGSACCQCPGGPAGNYRLYGPRDAERLAFVRRSRNLGFAIEEIRILLALADQKDRDCGAVDAIAREHLAEVECKIVGLERLARELRHLIGQCHGGKIFECRIIEALAPTSIPVPTLRPAESRAPRR